MVFQFYFSSLFFSLFFFSDLLKGLQPGAQHAAALSHSPLPAHLQQAYTGKDNISLTTFYNLKKLVIFLL